MVIEVAFRIHGEFGNYDSGVITRFAMRLHAVPQLGDVFFRDEAEYRVMQVEWLWPNPEPTCVLLEAGALE